LRIVAELFRVPRSPWVMHANYRNYRSSRGPTLPLCPIPGPKGDSNVAGLAGHGDGPFGQGRQVQHSDALDRLGGTQARHRRLAGQNLKTIRREYVDRGSRSTTTAAGRPLNNVTWTNVSISTTDAADTRGRILAISALKVSSSKAFRGRAATIWKRLGPFDGAASRYSAICSPDPPNSAGKSLNFGKLSRIGSTVSA
jgi:hypothetical protein